MMTYYAKIDKYDVPRDRIKENSLTKVVKYRFENVKEALQFVEDIKKIDDSIVSAEVEKSNF
jgi:hypothetical protein